jgi:hypothetical protein
MTVESEKTEQYRIIAPGIDNTLWHSARHLPELVEMVGKNNIPHLRNGKPGPWIIERRESSEPPDIS